MRKLFCGVILIILLANQIAVAAGRDEICLDKPEAQVAAVPTAQEMTKVLCNAAEQGVWKPASDSYLNQCGLGTKEGGYHYLQDLKSFIRALGNAAYAGFSGAKNLISSWLKEEDPAVAAERAAQANAQEAKSWLQTMKSYFDAANQLVAAFMKDLDHTARLVGGTMWCLPWTFKIEFLCQFVSQVALELGSLKTVVTAADKTLSVAKAIADFKKRTNLIDHLKDLSLSARMKAAAEALEKQNELRVLEKYGEAGNLVGRRDPITGKQVMYFEEIAYVDGKKVTALREILKDAKTGSIDANTETGRRLAVLDNKNNVGNIQMFIDVNNLGKVNYFKGRGVEAGDDYLKYVSQSIQKNLREGDRFYKNGGDELVVILKTSDANEAQRIIQRIHNSIDADRTLQNLFKEQRILKADEIRAPKRTNTFEEMKPPTAAQVKELQETAKIRPSVSIGSCRITGDWSKDLARAEKQAGQVKIEYKKEIGSEVSKYTGGFEEVSASRPNFKAKPKVYAPVE